MSAASPIVRSRAMCWRLVGVTLPESIQNHQYPDSPHYLRPRRDRPCCSRPAEERDEIISRDQQSKAPGRGRRRWADRLTVQAGGSERRRGMPLGAHVRAFGSRSQREKIPGGGASGKGVRNRIEAGGADCASVSSGLAVSGESEIGGFFGGSTTVCGRCSLRAAALIFFFGALAASFGIFFGAITGAASGALPGNTSPSPVKFTVSNHREMVIFRSSIAAHPARPKLADTVIETSATRAQPPIDTPAIRGVAGSLSGHWDGCERDTVRLPRG